MYDRLIHLIDDLTSSGDVKARVVAEKVYAGLKEDPEFEKISEQLVINAIYEIVRGRLRSLKAKAVHGRSAANFAAATRKYESRIPGAEEELVERYMTSTYVVAPGTKRHLCDMTRDDLTYAANSYRAQTKTVMMQIAFLDELARHVGDRTVGEVFTEEKLVKMFESLA